MYICNFKLDFKKLFIAIAIIAIVIALFIEVGNMLNEKKVSYNYVLDENNYTTVLKEVHDNIEGNIGKTIKLSGFVFRLPDFEKGYFVCGRNMLLNNDEKVVGFLCFTDKDIDLKDSEWVEITGEIIKGYYMTDMPVIKITSINKIPSPANTFVETPDFLN